jgi:hypothetical protein
VLLERFHLDPWLKELQALKGVTVEWVYFDNDLAAANQCGWPVAGMRRRVVEDYTSVIGVVAAHVKASKVLHTDDTTVPVRDETQSVRAAGIKSRCSSVSMRCCGAITRRDRS